MVATHTNFIDGASADPAAGRFADAHSPVTGEAHVKVARSGAADVEKAVASAASAQRAWADLKPIERGRILMKMAAHIREQMSAYAEIEIQETGKPSWQAPLELGGAANYLEFYAGLGNVGSGEMIDLGADYHAYTVAEPYGVIGVITPWNAPLNQLCRAIGPALITGNAVVAKPSEFTSGTTLRLAKDAVEQCGLPPGVLNVVIGDGPDAGAALVSHAQVAKVAFTGSVRGGREVGKVAAERIIPLTLELGGKSPNIVFDDADLALAAPGSLMGFALNAGQVCSAGTRCLVHRPIYDAFLGALEKAVATLKVGPEPDAMVGAITTHAQYQQVQRFFDVAASDGARLVVGGKEAPRPDSWGAGWYAPITVYADVRNDMRIAREEIFGPILAVIPFDTEDEAVSIANDTEYGLNAGIWTNTLSRAHRVAARVQAGTVTVNEYLTSDVELPFGGFGKSGYGKEKGVAALHYYTRLKSVRIKL